MAETYEPKSKLNIIADEPDNRLLELAESSNADFYRDWKHERFYNEFAQKN